MFKKKFWMVGHYFIYSKNNVLFFYFFKQSKPLQDLFYFQNLKNLEEVDSSSNSTGNGTRETDLSGTTLLDGGGWDSDIASWLDTFFADGGGLGFILGWWSLGSWSRSDWGDSGWENWSTADNWAGGDSDSGVSLGSGASIFWARSDGDGTWGSDSVSLGAVNDFSGFWAVGGVSGDNFSGGDIAWDGDGGNVSVTSRGNTSKEGSGSDSELHFC